MSIDDAVEQLRAALRTVPKLKVRSNVGEVLDPPAAVVGPPRLTPDAYGPELTTATFIVGLVVPDDERALPRLYDLIPLVTTALHNESSAVVVSADPGTWPAGGGLELPAYLIEVEMSL